MQETRSAYTWNFVDKRKGFGPQYAGLLVGIKDLSPPVRLSFYPYTSLYASAFPDAASDVSASLGLDVKYE